MALLSFTFWHLLAFSKSTHYNLDFLIFFYQTHFALKSVENLCMPFNGIVFFLIFVACTHINVENIWCNFNLA